MADAGVCFGGRFDGVRVERTASDWPWAWVNLLGHAYRAPADGRALYLAGGGGRWWAALPWIERVCREGRTVCAGCGGVVVPDPLLLGDFPEHCPLCGRELAGVGG